MKFPKRPSEPIQNPCGEETFFKGDDYFPIYPGDHVDGRPAITLESETSIAREAGKLEEKERVNKCFDDQMNYWVKTIQKMEHIGCKEGAHAASIALEVVRDIYTELVDMSGDEMKSLFDSSSWDE